MKLISITAVVATLVGCATPRESVGVEPSKPERNTTRAEATIGVVYYAPAWGPNTNGEEVVYFLKQVTLSSRNDEQTRIYFCSVKPDGTNRREIAQLWKENPDQIIESFAAAVTMEVNAATKRVAIGIEMGQRGGIFLFNLDGTGLISAWPKEWNADRPKEAGYPTWSPDGQWLAFQEMRDEKDFYLYRIAKMRPDGTGYTSLTERNAQNAEPAWSPQGDLIAYTELKTNHLWLMKPDGSEKRDAKASGNKPRWSPDGKFILQDTYSVIDPVSHQVVRRHPFDKNRQGMQMWPKWGNSGFVFVDSRKIGLTSLTTDKTSPLCENILRRVSLSDSEKESYRW